MTRQEVIFLIGAFIVAFVFSFAATPLVKIWAVKLKVVDIPKDGRRMHKHPIPLSGRTAIIFGL